MYQSFYSLFLLYIFIYLYNIYNLGLATLNKDRSIYKKDTCNVVAINIQWLLRYCSANSWVLLVKSGGQLDGVANSMGDYVNKVEILSIMIFNR
jgi:hypothetical protein